MLRPATFRPVPCRLTSVSHSLLSLVRPIRRESSALPFVLYDSERAIFSDLCRTSHRAFFLVCCYESALEGPQLGPSRALWAVFDFEGPSCGPSKSLEEAEKGGDGKGERGVAAGGRRSERDAGWRNAEAITGASDGMEQMGSGRGKRAEMAKDSSKRQRGEV